MAILELFQKKIKFLSFKKNISIFSYFPIFLIKGWKYLEIWSEAFDKTRQDIVSDAHFVKLCFFKGFLVFEIGKNLDLRKILVTMKIFLKSRVHCM